LTLLIKMPATVTFYRGHRRTLSCLGIIFKWLLFRRRTRLTRPRLELRTSATAWVTLHCTWLPSD